MTTPRPNVRMIHLDPHERALRDEEPPAPWAGWLCLLAIVASAAVCIGVLYLLLKVWP